MANSPQLQKVLDLTRSNGHTKKLINNLNIQIT